MKDTHDRLEGVPSQVTVGAPDNVAGAASGRGQGASSYYPSFGRTSITTGNCSLRAATWAKGKKNVTVAAANDGTSSPTLAQRRLVFIAACALVARFAPFVSAAAATAITLEVGATGGLPGFHSGELRRYLAFHMTEIGLGDWRFEPGNEPALAGGRRRGRCIFGGGGEWMSGKG